MDQQEPTTEDTIERSRTSVVPEGTVGPSVEVLATTMRIHELRIEHPAIVAYLKGIPAGKQAIALIHALAVGVTEMTARRERFRN